MDNLVLLVVLGFQNLVGEMYTTVAVTERIDQAVAIFQITLR